MTRLSWGQPGQRFFEAGVDRGVFYPRVGDGVAWVGLVSVEESSSGGEHTPLHFDGIKYMDVLSAEDFTATIEAFSAPAEFAACAGQKSLAPGLFATQQPRDTFGFSYRSGIGNDLDESVGYKLHLVYNATAMPSSNTARTLVGKASSADTRQWAVETVPPLASTYKPTAHLILDTRYTTASKIESVENLLYGTSTVAPQLPTQAQVVALLS